MKHLILFITMLFPIVSCGDDSVEKPTAVEEVIDSTLLDNDEDVTSSTVPEIVWKRPVPDPAEANIPLPVLVINTYSINIDSVESLDKRFGDPVSILEDDTHDASLRFYELPDGNIIEFAISRGEFRTIILYYRRGYPTALQAAEAAGFIQNGLELEKQTDTIESYTILDSQIFNAIQIDKDKYGVWSECYIVFD